MTVRPRVEADLDRCVDLATAVHDVDGYPPYLPGNLREFVASPDTIGAWVAEHDGLIAGRVRFDAPDGSSFEELVYVGPSSCARATYSHA